MIDSALKWFALVGLMALLGSRIYRIRELRIMYRALDASWHHRLGILWFVTTRMLLGLDGTSQEARLLQTLAKATEIGPAYGAVSFLRTYRYLLALWMTIGRFGSDFEGSQFLESCKRLNPSASWVYGREGARRIAKRRTSMAKVGIEEEGNEPLE